MIIEQSIRLQHLGQAIFIARWLKRLSRKKLAKLAKVSEPTIRSVERGAASHNTKTFFSIIEQLPVEIEFRGVGDAIKLSQSGLDHYGEIIRLYRSRMNDGAGWTLDRVAKESKLSQPAVSSMERGHGGRLSSFIKVLNAMKINIHFTFKITKNEPS